MKKSTLRVVALIWAALMIAVLSSTLTLLISGRTAQTRNVEERWVTQAEYDSIRRYSRLDEVRASLLRDYYQDLDEDALILGAIRGMTGAVGDPFTFYYTPEEMRRADENNAGMYHGIGTLLQNTADGMLEIIRVFENSPAEAAGVRPGDVIVGVDGETVSGADGRSYSDAVARIRGENGSRVVLTVLRDGARMDIPVTRGDVSVSYARHWTLPGNIGYIGVTQFSGNAAEAFRQAVAEFREQGVEGLVVDLRDNPGGMLDQAISIADALLPKGLVVYVREKDGARQDYYSSADYFDVPLAVLVNGNSASASEIVALAVQAFDRGVVVGVNTYGKGIVQSLHSFPEDGAGIQITTSSYYDALDRCPQGVGVQPDVEVALTASSVPLEPDPQSDNQLAEAIAQVKRRSGD